MFLKALVAWKGTDCVGKGCNQELGHNGKLEGGRFKANRRW